MQESPQLDVLKLDDAAGEHVVHSLFLNALVVVEADAWQVYDQQQRSSYMDCNSSLNNGSVSMTGNGSSSRSSEVTDLGRLSGLVLITLLLSKLRMQTPPTVMLCTALGL